MKSILNFALLLIFCPAIRAQEITLTPKWKVGDEWQVSIQSTVPGQEKGVMNNIRCEAIWKVEAKNETGFILSWQYTDYQSDTSTIDINALPQERLNYSAVNAGAMRYQVDDQGMLLDMLSPEVIEAIILPFLPDDAESLEDQDLDNSTVEAF